MLRDGEVLDVREPPEAELTTLLAERVDERPRILRAQLQRALVAWRALQAGDEVPLGVGMPAKHPAALPALITSRGPMSRHDRRRQVVNISPQWVIPSVLGREGFAARHSVFL